MWYIGAFVILYLIYYEIEYNNYEMGRNKKRNKNRNNRIHNIFTRKSSHITQEYRKLLVQMQDINSRLPVSRTSEMVEKQTKDMMRLRYPLIKNIDKQLIPEPLKDIEPTV